MAAKILGRLSETLAAASREGLRRSLRKVERLSARESVVDGRRCLDFSSNDYLGLSFRPELKEEALRWTRQMGCGSGASRLISGGSPECLELEGRIAAWKGFEAALLLGSGYAANMGLIPALAARGSTVLADKLNHASLNGGCVLSQASFKRYRHNDAAQLQKLLAQAGPDSECLVVSDSVFSMDGDVAPLEELRRVSSEAGAFLYVDDAHASGVFGGRGEGLAKPESCDLAMGTFSKAMGSYGAYAACSAELKDYLVNKCGPFIYSTALPPPVLGSVSAAVAFVQTPEADAMRAHLAELSSSLRSSLTSLGFDVGASSTMIVPVIVGDASKCLALSAALLDSGVFAPPVRPPTVPKESSRLRISLNAAHTHEDIALLSERLAAAAPALGIHLSR